MIRINPGDVGKRIDIQEITTARKVVGKLESVTKRNIVIETDTHAKIYIPFPILQRNYKGKIH